jgi:Protein of unknown function (DUF4236)
MGFYLRKSFSFGPVRLNLSKSGLGASLGVKGLRIGTGPRGAYLHAGREGLYFRQSLRSGATGPVDGKSTIEPLAGPSGLSDSDALMWGGFLFAVAFIVVGQAEPNLAPTFIPLGGVSFLVGVISLWANTRYRRRLAAAVRQRRQDEVERDGLAERYKAVLQQISKGEDPAIVVDIRQLRADPQFPRTAFGEEERRAYREALSWDLTQQASGAASRAWGAQVAKALSLDMRAAFDVSAGHVSGGVALRPRRSHA